MTELRGALRAACGFGLALAALSGCTEWAPGPRPEPPPPPPSAAFDGRYVGTVRQAGGSGGIDPAECAVEPQVTFEVRDGRFDYTQNFSRLLAAAPTARDIARATYHAEIAADGTITGLSENNAVLRGRVEGGRMSGNIYGLLCYFSFTADRR